ncbi:hypothetical protein C2E23DRAFT_906804 [Lenzites betulinus]|nr:hypothetical protein C2E23DRAFT_906804 [Lenzites betulinus]
MGNPLLLLAMVDAIRRKLHRHPFDTDSPFLRVSPSTSLRILPSILPRIPPPKMSYAAFAPARACAYAYAAPASPNAFALFASPQSPRDTYHTYEDARQVLRPSNGRAAAPKAKTSTLKKLFGM